MGRYDTGSINTSTTDSSSFLQLLRGSFGYAQHQCGQLWQQCYKRSIKSAFFIDRSGITVSGTPITIPTATYADSVAAPSDKAGALESLAISEFLPGLRLPKCTLQPASLAHIAALAPYGAGLSLQEKIILGIFFPALFLTLPVFTAFVWYKSYKNRVSDGERQGAFSERDSEAYSSQKAELEVGEINQQRVSIAVQKAYEIAGDHGKVEMPEGRGEHGILSSLLAKHELKGEEHSKELEAPSQECKE